MDYQWLLHYRPYCWLNDYFRYHRRSQLFSKQGDQPVWSVTNPLVPPGWMPGNGTIMGACDGWLVLDCLKSYKLIDPFMAHADHLQACQQIISSKPCTICFTCVKGQQDVGHPTVLSHKAWWTLKWTCWSRVKLTPLYQAKQHLRCCLSHDPWWLSNKKIVKHPKWAMCLALNGLPKWYYDQKLPTLSPSLAKPSIMVTEWAMSKSTPSCTCCWVSKHITGHFSHGKIWYIGKHLLRAIHFPCTS